MCFINGLYQCAKFGWNRRSRPSFDNMHVFRFHQFGWRTPIHAPKIGGFGDLTPQIGRHINETPKRHILGQKDVMAYRSSKSVHRCDLWAWRRDEKREKRQGQKPNNGKLGNRWDHPRHRIEMKFCMVGGVQMVVLRHHRTTLSGYIFATKARIDNRKKKLVKQQYVLQMSPQYGELPPTSGWDRFVSLGHPT